MNLPLSRVTGVLLLSVAISACKPADEAGQAAVEQAHPAKLWTLAKADNPLQRTYPGTLQASEKTDLAFRVSGQLAELPAYAGLEVKRGDLLARLDESDYQNALDASRAQYQLAKVQYDQTLTLSKRKLASQSQLDQATAALRSAEADLAQARNNLRYTSLTATFDGLVARLDVENFQSIQAGQTVLHLSGNDSLSVHFSVPETLISMLGRVSDPAILDKICAQVSFNNHPGHSYTACHKEHELVPDSLTRTYGAEFVLTERPDFAALPGMSVNVLLDLSAIAPEAAKAQIFIPVEAVMQRGESTLVWRVDDEQRIRPTPVELGPLTNAGFILRDGLAEGDRIAIAGIHTLRDGMLVKPLSKERGL
ncbi:efflux RND transporter periplasmic adaptor subunit [Granulosicoccaceae sp. 1_MG-2023]|nr:efflux RND transporter periplasmic adaptor subunit [Granulosicoccaceae sp. 1_MG-2023]